MLQELRGVRSTGWIRAPMLLLSWCLMSSDVIWHIRDKLWPMPKHGSIRKVYACLAVTCHLHFWQNDRDFLRATVVTRGWNGYRNKSQHRKSTLEKKILPPFQQGFEPATFQSRVRRSNHWAIPAPGTDPTRTIHVEDSNDISIVPTDLPSQDLFRTKIQVNCDTVKLVTITILYSTGTILVQGNRCPRWIDEEFSSSSNALGPSTPLSTGWRSRGCMKQ